jgi:hypothetical protein
VRAANHDLIKAYTITEADAPRPRVRSKLNRGGEEQQQARSITQDTYDSHLTLGSVISESVVSQVAHIDKLTKDYRKQHNTSRKVIVAANEDYDKARELIE